jgi:hypothetical protein
MWLEPRRQAEAGENTSVAHGSLLGVFQCDDGEDGPPIHAPHARAVAHEVVVDGGTVRANLQKDISPR